MGWGGGGGGGRDNKIPLCNPGGPGTPQLRRLELLTFLLFTAAVLGPQLWATVPGDLGNF